MKLPYLIAVFTLLVSVSLYALVYGGYQTLDCSIGESHITAGSVDQLERYDDQNNDFELKSYRILSPNLGECVQYTDSSSEDVDVVEGGPNFTPGMDPGKTKAVVFIPQPFPVAFLVQDFDAEKNQELLDDWQSKTNIAPIVNWVGIETGIKWTAITPYEWEITREPLLGAFGRVNWLKNPPKIEMWIENIYREAKANNLPFEHVVMQIQMEEHIHALQADTEENDGDKLKRPTPADIFAMEVEAKTFIQEIIWPYVYGMQPPYLMRPVEKPADYDDNREEYNKLRSDLITYGLNGIQRLRYNYLEGYFANPDKVPKVISDPNPNYQGESNTGEED